VRIPSYSLNVIGCGRLHAAGGDCWQGREISFETGTWPRHHEHDNNPPPLRSDIDEADVRALQEENAELRRLVIQLSKLVVKNVLDHR